MLTPRMSKVCWGKELAPILVFGPLVQVPFTFFLKSRHLILAASRFRFGHNCLLICLLSVDRIDAVGAHQAEHKAQELVS